MIKLLKRLKKVDWRKGTGTFVLGYAMMLLALFVALVLVEQYTRYNNALDTQMAVDSISDGTASYASTLRGYSRDDFYEESYDRAKDLSYYIMDETNVKNIDAAYMDEDQFNDEDTVFIKIRALYGETSRIDETGYNSGNGQDFYGIVRTSATKFKRPGLTGNYAWPIQYNFITSAFGGPRNVEGGSVHHMGIDIQGPYGTPFYAVADGTVTGVHTDDYHSIYIEHGEDENGNKIYSRYEHGNAIPSLHVGQQVRMGEQIGTTAGWGPDGANSYDAHLHMNAEVVDAGTGFKTYYNPLYLFYGLEPDGDVFDNQYSCTLQGVNGTFFDCLHFGTNSGSEFNCFRSKWSRANVYYEYNGSTRSH